jgi:hypothetical protein
MLDVHPFVFTFGQKSKNTLRRTNEESDLPSLQQGFPAAIALVWTLPQTRSKDLGS